MHFDSLDELAKKYVGDYQLLQPPHNPYNYSTNVEWDQNDNKYFVELYNFRSGAETATVDVRTDGCTYYWPQDIRTDQ